MSSETRPKIRVREIHFHSLPTRTRFPFKYGIASMTEVPHLLVSSVLEIDGKMARGLASEGLPPKWFTKNPDTNFEEDDLPRMLEVIAHAASSVTGITTPCSFFEIWERLYSEQSFYAGTSDIPPLLANLGTSLMERTILDGVCRSLKTPVHQVITGGALGLAPSEIHEELGGHEVEDLLATDLPDSILVRHTVGLGDPLRPEDIPTDEAAEDGLPQALTDCISAYGLTHFKIKICGAPDTDIPRLEALAEILKQQVGPALRFSLDGNEQFNSMADFRRHWELCRDSESVRDLIENHLLFVEQPVHRDSALSDEVGLELEAWTDAPPLIIDESDGALDDLPHALALGYRGTSHKNCKGIFKGIANACLLEWRRRMNPGAGYILSGEDLCNLGPVALLQDLAMMQTLGISHVERNGHHYMKGLSAFPLEVQDVVLRDHGDLYQRHTDGFACLRIEGGSISLASVKAAPFGLEPLLDASTIAPPIAMPEVESGQGMM